MGASHAAYGLIVVAATAIEPLSTGNEDTVGSQPAARPKRTLPLAIADDGDPAQVSHS